MNAVVDRPQLRQTQLDDLAELFAKTLAPGNLSWLGSAVLGPVAGWLVARRNPRLVVLTGLAAAVLPALRGARLDPVVAIRG